MHHLDQVKQEKAVQPEVWISDGPDEPRTLEPRGRERVSTDAAHDPGSDRFSLRFDQLVCGRACSLLSVLSLINGGALWSPEPSTILDIWDLTSNPF